MFDFVDIGSDPNIIKMNPLLVNTFSLACWLKDRMPLVISDVGI